MKKRIHLSKKLHSWLGPIGLQNILDIQDVEAWMQMMATNEAGQKTQ